jgi:GxxExxY protein
MKADRGDNEGTVIDLLTEKIIECVIAVHSELGPGFGEAIYHNAMVMEANKRQLNFESQAPISIYYDGQIVGKHRLDLVFGGQVIVELKSVEELAKKHYSQLRAYLKATGLKVGLLVNFDEEKANFRRIELARPSPRSAFIPSISTQ